MSIPWLDNTHLYKCTWNQVYNIRGKARRFIAPRKDDEEGRVAHDGDFIEIVQGHLTA